MTDDSERLLFRMNHIIPRSLSTSFTNSGGYSITNKGIVPPNHVFEDVVFQMTWGKVAGKE